MKKTLLLVFIHGFKGSDHTFQDFPKDIRTQLAKALPNINVLTIQYPQFDTRGDLKACVANFREWLQNKVIDLEVSNQTPSPTVEPSVGVILCGHSMGGIVAAETLLSIAHDEPILTSSYANDTTNSTTAQYDPAQGSSANRPINLDVSEEENKERASSAPPPEPPSVLLFPHVQAILAFDTPYLGISPGVLAHGAEEQASTAYKAWDTANKFFGWGTPKPAAAAPAPTPEAAAAAGGSNWGRYAMYGGAAAAIAGVAGAAYLNWAQINQGLTWASSHLEFVGCLARGAELQKRVEKVVDMTRTHNTGFANFYGALGEQVTSRTKYAGAILGQDRTFCVVPKASRKTDSPIGSKRAHTSSSDQQQQRQQQPAAKKRKSQGEADMQAEMSNGDQVHRFVEDTSKSKGRWIKCVNSAASDELVSHTTMFERGKNPDYGSMLDRTREQIVEWVGGEWYEGSVEESVTA